MQASGETARQLLDQSRAQSGMEVRSSYGYHYSREGFAVHHKIDCHASFGGLQAWEDRCKQDEVFVTYRRRVTFLTEMLFIVVERNHNESRDHG